MTCFGRSGIHTSSMSEVIAESGLSAGAVYLYFRSKEDLISAVAEEFLHGLLTTFEKILTADPPLSPADMAGRLLDLLTADAPTAPVRHLPLLLAVWSEGARDPVIHDLTSYWLGELRGRFTRALERYDRVAGLRIAPDALAPAVMATVQGFLLQTALGGGLDQKEFRRTVATLLESAEVGTPSHSDRRVAEHS